MPAHLRWKGALLEDLRLAYADRSRSTKEIAQHYGISPDRVSKLARQHGWPMRPRSALPKARAVKRMTPQQRTIYFKLRGLLPQEQAAMEACR